jgi:NADPH-dependent 2,4-dienoyl-CoA reductase/sulfur reductase-like enzyme
MHEPIIADVAIVGGGPAGIAAAVSLRRSGVERVTIVEREATLGGVPRHCGHPPFGMREFHRILTGPAYARQLSDMARDAGVDRMTGTTVVALQPSATLDIATSAGLSQLRAKRVILATGIRENSRAARFIAGDRPLGVITTGTLQHAVHVEHLAPFRRPVIVGTELVSLSSVLTCRHAGIHPVAVIEKNMRPTARRALALFPRLLGIPMHYGADIVDIRGRGRVEAVTIRHGDGKLQELACDGVLLTGCFVPEAALVRASHLTVDQGSGGPAIDQSGRCSDPTYYAAGNLLRPVETAGWCFREGTRIAELVADDLAGRLPAIDRTIPIILGMGVKLAVPQRLALPLTGNSYGHLQLRVDKAMTGTLSVRGNSKVLWRKHASFLPERRILIPVAALRPGLENIETVSIGFDRE